MSQQIRGQGGHLVFPIGPKNTNFIGIMMLCKLTVMLVYMVTFTSNYNNTFVSNNITNGKHGLTCKIFTIHFYVA